MIRRNQPRPRQHRQFGRPMAAEKAVDLLERDVGALEVMGGRGRSGDSLGLGEVSAGEVEDEAGRAAAPAPGSGVTGKRSERAGELRGAVECAGEVVGDQAEVGHAAEERAAAAGHDRHRKAEVAQAGNVGRIGAVIGDDLMDRREVADAAEGGGLEFRGIGQEHHPSGRRDHGALHGGGLQRRLGEARARDRVGADEGDVGAEIGEEILPRLADHA